MDIPEPLSHLYKRTLRIVAHDGGISSSFVTDYKGQQWLVTGIHCVEDRRPACQGELSPLVHSKSA